MTRLLERIGGGEALLADGAMGTLLFARGLPDGAPPESVALSNPEWLVEIARAYIDAGADIVQTNTFGGSPLKLTAGGLSRRTAEINARSAELARRAAAGRPVLVAGDCGPCGRLLQPLGDASPDEVRDGFELQFRSLADGGVDLFVVETMTDLAEASIAVRAARRAAPSVPVVATMTFDRTPRGFFTIMGVDVAAACRGLEEAGADIVGANCGAGSDAMVALASEFRRATSLPLAIQPNAGLPRLAGGRVVHPEAPEEMALRIGQLLQAGVLLVGGCCGTTPEHIRAFRKVVDAWNRRGPARGGREPGTAGG